MLVIVCCPLCGETWEALGTPGRGATVIVECPRCGHVFDVAQPVAEVDRS